MSRQAALWIVLPVLALAASCEGIDEDEVGVTQQAATTFDNPIIKTMFTADPAALVVNGTIYLYTGRDEAAIGTNAYVMREWRVWTSTNAVSWTDRGSPLAVSAFSWATGDAWAAQVCQRNGLYYFYAPVNTSQGRGIGVAVSSSPLGPFTDARGTPLISNNQTPGGGNFDDIDPSCFIDDDGQAYLYWGNTTLKYIRLNANMTSTTGPIVTVSVPNFTEAPWLHKRNGIYYLSYATEWPERIAYATSNSAVGPWTFRGVIAQLVPNSTTVHQSIVELNGQSYFFYHHGALPTGGDFRRSVCMEELFYNADGTIQPIVYTHLPRPGRRIQSFNFQTSYVRHQNTVGRIDSSVTPFYDSLFRVVPGLASSGGGLVSFESVNFPGRFIRHRNNQIFVEQNDNTALFRADATFRQVAGLASSSWSSFQSYNFPTRYIRHRNFVLYSEVPSTATDRADATFRLVD